MTNHYRFTVTLTLAAPVMSQASGARTFGIDAAQIRDEQNRPALPGTLIRGNLRHAWERLWCAHAPEERWPPPLHLLGEESQGTQNSPNRARLGFSPYWSAEDAGDAGVRHRIQIHPTQGSVKPGSLQVIEAPFRFGAAIVFSGRISGWLTEAEAEHLEFWLTKGFGFVAALGALKGAGFGRVLDSRVERTLVPPEQPARIPAGDRYRLLLTLDRPFCFARSHTGSDNNRFESEDFIPGAAIKAAIARRLLASSVLCACLDELRISHAFPAAPNHPRPRSLPLSWAVDGEDQLWDLALKTKPGLLDHKAPTFQPDWKGKHWDKATQVGGWPVLRRRLAVRTAIKPGHTRAEDEKLFAIESIDPQGLVWLADLSLPELSAAEQARVLDELLDLTTAPLDSLGKTKANAELSLAQGTPAPGPEEPSLIRDSLAVVYLQTPALLLPSPGAIPPTNGGQALQDAYRQSWRRLSEGSLDLSHFFARQQLVGGKYLWRRFWDGDKKPPRPYHPQLLTEAGSVFVLKVIDESKARARLADWQAWGLPPCLPEKLKDTWQANPYQRQNGYGEVLINWDCHWNMEPKENWHELKPN